MSGRTDRRALERWPVERWPVGRRAAISALAAAGLAPLLGCSKAGASDTGAASGSPDPVAPSKGARRIVSISPSATEAVFALGRGSELVGRTTFCDEPPEAKAVPEIGGFADPSLERIIALSPTLAVGERGPAGPRLVEALDQRGIATYFPPIASIADIQAFLTGLGERLDALKIAHDLVRVMELELQLTEAENQGLKRPRVLFVFDFKPIVVAGPGSFPDEVLRRANGENVVRAGAMYPQLGPEGILALDPDMVIDGSAPGVSPGDPLEMLRAIEGLSSLRAVRDKRVGRLASTSALRPGPRIAKGVAEVSNLLRRLARITP